MTLRIASAFAGIGGFEEGARRAGAEVLDSIEIEPSLRAILARHFPITRLHGDINDVAAQDLAKHLDAFVGGFPCQDTSIAAPHRRGLDGERGGQFYPFVELVESYLRLTDELYPEWVVIENPDGLLKSRRGADFTAVREGLAQRGYGVAWRVVDGGHLGSPQRRRRVLVVAHLGGDARPAGAVLGIAPTGGIAPGPNLGGTSGQGGPGLALAPVWRKSHSSATAPAIWRKSARPTKSRARGGFETWVRDGRANTLTGFDGGLATRQTHLVDDNGRPRTFTPVEWERLQGFPDDWTDLLATSARWPALGNAIHVGTAEWLFRGLVREHTRAALAP